MTDDGALTVVRDRLAQVRNALDDVPPPIPADDIFARARRRRSRRWLATAGAGCAALGLTLGLVVPSGSQPHPVHVDLAAWSVDTNPNGTVTFKLRNISQPARLQHVLTEAGVPAVVRWGVICLAQGHELRPARGIIVNVGVPGRPMPTPPRGLALNVATKNAPIEWIINPAKIPAGARFVVSAEPRGHPSPTNVFLVAWELAPRDAPIACNTVK